MLCNDVDLVRIKVGDLLTKEQIDVVIRRPNEDRTAEPNAELIVLDPIVDRLELLTKPMNLGSQAMDNLEVVDLGPNGR